MRNTSINRYLCLLLCAASWSASAALSPPQATAIDALFANHVHAQGPGAAVAIYQGGQQIYAKGYGLASLEHPQPIDPHTPFNSASISKHFTAVAVAMLAKEGRLELDADIRRYLPQMPDFGTPITVRQLVHHQSGLREAVSLLTLAGHEAGGLIRQAHAMNLIARQRQLNFLPGSRFEYTNTNYLLLAEIVHAVSGQTLRAFTEERLFGPLGMNDTAFADDVREVIPGRADSYTGSSDRWRRSVYLYETWGPGNLNTSVSDLSTWMRNLAHPKVGDPALFQQLMQPSRLNDGSTANYGFALWQDVFNGHTAWIHTGSAAGFRAIFAYFPTEDFGVAILTNTPFYRHPIVASIVSMLLDEGEVIAAPSSTTVDPAPSLLQRLPGTYAAAGRPIIQVSDDGLSARTLAGPTVPLQFRQNGHFDLGQPGSMQFVPTGPPGQPVQALELRRPMGGETANYRRASRAPMSDKALRALAGRYRSEELDVTLDLSAEDGHLVMRSLWLAQPAVFAPSIDGQLDAISGPLDDFILTVGPSDADGRPSLYIHAGAMFSLALERIAIQAKP